MPTKSPHESDEQKPKPISDETADALADIASYLLNHRRRRLERQRQEQETAPSDQVEPQPPKPQIAPAKAKLLGDILDEAASAAQAETNTADKPPETQPPAKKKRKSKK